MPVATKNLQKDRDFVRQNRERLLKEYLNKYLLVHDEKIVSSFDSYEAAAAEGIRQFGMDGIFLVQQITEAEPLNFVMEAVL